MKKVQCLCFGLLVILLVLSAFLPSCSSNTEQSSAGSTKTEAAVTTKTKAPILLRFADSVGLEDQWMAVQFADKFNQRANGEAVIEVHYFEELVAMPEMVDAIQKGIIEMANFPLGAFANLDQRFSIGETPFLFASIDANRDSAPNFLSKYGEIFEEKYNQKLLGINTISPNELISSKKPVQKLDDWDNLLVQSISPLTASVIDCLGGVPVNLPFNEAYPAMQKGIVNATINSSDFVRVVKLWEVAKYFTRSRLIIPHIATTINMDVFNSLSSETQTALKEEALAYSYVRYDNAKKLEAALQDTLEKNGMKVINLDQAERDKWAEKLYPLREKTVESLGDFGKSMLQYAEESNKKFPYSPG